jgi:hypothetical protein
VVANWLSFSPPTNTAASVAVLSTEAEGPPRHLLAGVTSQQVPSAAASHRAQRRSV